MKEGQRIEIKIKYCKAPDQHHILTDNFTFAAFLKSAMSNERR